MKDNFLDTKPENLTWWMLVSIFLSQLLPSNDLFHHFGRIIILLYKVGPKTSHKWGEITPAKPIYFRPFITTVVVSKSSNCLGFPKVANKNLWNTIPVIWHFKHRSSSMFIFTCIDGFIKQQKTQTRWCFQTSFVFTPTTSGNDPIWLMNLFSNGLKTN